MSRIHIFTGHFGSGKTEIAVNYAMMLSRKSKGTILVDLDIINPFFRSSEVKEVLEQEGVRVISPVFALTTVDVPSLPAAIQSVFQTEQGQVVFDVGGDEVGARVLGRYYHYFSAAGYEMFYVINTRRPLSSTSEDIIEMLEAVQDRSRLQVTGLISNTNLSYETEVSHILEGQMIVEEVGRRRSLPVVMTCASREVFDQLSDSMKEKIFPLNLYMTPPWRD